MPERSIEPLPFVDEHAVRIEAPAATTWAALLRVVGRGWRGGPAIARALGCDPARGTAGFAGRRGDAVPGFRVVEAAPGRRLELRGRHRFADYALTFEIDGERLRARTEAAFPGFRGRLYRAAVIGSGAHRIVTLGLLRRVAGAARRARKGERCNSERSRSV